MATAKLCTSGTLDAMKPEEGNDPLDIFIKHTIGRESLLPFARTSDNPVQWVQLLHALDQPDLSGWPLLTPVNVQMQKCEKCPLEFCSPINYRRHIRVHRKSLNVNKDTQKNRDLLAAFWDKISPEQAKEVVSFNNLMLKEIPGSSFIEALEAPLHNIGFWTIPHPYAKAAKALLGIIRANPSGPPPISSQELFSILDDVSEKTFLCAGTAASVQKYVFDGDVSRNYLELKNAVACTSFLFEMQLVKVWNDDKDAKALKCHMLLVEEEEAAQKRQAMLLEKKRQKKLRKEQKAKEQLYGNMEVIVDPVDVPASAEASRSSSPSASSSNPLDIPTSEDSPLDIPTSEDSPLELTQPQIKESNEDSEAQIDIPNEHIKQSDDSQTTKLQMAGPNGNRHPATNHWQAPPRSHRGSRFGFNPQPLKSESTMLKPGPPKDRSLQNVTKIWTKKLKIDTEKGENQSQNQKQEPPSQEKGENQYQKQVPPQEKGENQYQKQVPPSQEEEGNQVEEDNCEVIIGSISVTLKKSVANQQDKKNASEKSAKANNVQKSQHWRPVCNETKSVLLPLDRGNSDSGESDLSGKVPDQILSSETSKEQSESIDRVDNLKAAVPFSSSDAKEFLDQRWKEAIASDHVRLVLSEPKPPGSSDVVQSESPTASSNASDPPKNQTGIVVQAKVSKNQDKGVKLKYRPKQKTAA